MKASGGWQRTLGIIKPDILVPSLPSLFRRNPPINLDLLLSTPPHLLFLPASRASNPPQQTISSTTAASASSERPTRQPSTFLSDVATNPEFEELIRESFPTSMPADPQARTPLEVVLDLIVANGFEIVASRFMEMTIEEAERFYGEHEGRFFYQRLVAFMTSGPIVPIVLAKQDAIAQWRALMGPTHIDR